MAGASSLTKRIAVVATSLGVDAVGRTYVISLRGDVFRLDPKLAT